ncbi:lipoprotein [Rhodanobacter spathiphylli B39]|uniref:Lipoprotein n=2 Tax=Rhodanobacter TaxID=75309 RepID=I4VVP6_9GAMM|nr:lipoprotein [Rhodanobacter spathiphylli B39]
MNRPKRFLPSTVALAALALLVAGCSGAATREIEAERAALHSDPVSMSAKNLPEVSINASGAVKVGTDQLSLTAGQRALTRDYRAAVIELVDLTLSGTARITDHAMSRVLLASLIGRGDEAGEKIGRQAEAMVHSPPFCQLLDRVRQSQDRMVRSVVTLQPYAKIDAHAVENCRAGKPYDASI